MPFGKHKGEEFSKIPMSYWNWALANFDALNEESDNFDPDFAASVAHLLGEKLG
jgi:hypothetical protein